MRAYELVRARDLLQQAVAAEPDFPLAHSALAEAWSALGYDAKAQEQAAKAVELADDLPREDRQLIKARNHEMSWRWDEAIESYRAAPTFHTDLTPTILDLLGLWQLDGLRGYRRHMPGHSLLRGGAEPATLSLTNCSGVWGCAFENWGYMRRNLKLESRSWDTGYKCYDLELDPFEQVDLGVQACGDLFELARQTYRRVPGEDLPKPEKD